MPFYNKILLMGNLTKDVELRYTPQGTAVSRFRIAVNRSYKDSQGEWKGDTLFINVVAWSFLAERCAETLSKGDNVFVEGRLDMRNYEYQGQKRTVFEVVANKVSYIPRRGDTKEIPEDIGESEEIIEEDIDASSENDVPF
ncbi:MAG: single-stranded DNA-binding protein [Candidatus Coatesbacteria bacterium]|nr:MAG: single-stranded DNA-binding protein [Candidatus Coatesbacteria bacterium]RLC41243.1 MAG: single-stranded DNA-binding protein [Candidatus Coatesbacteria bacterium]RLC42662.1 MAG: single-stranded DNA-binding protein [Candidatus Coatesbacteria bacterium]